MKMTIAAARATSWAARSSGPARLALLLAACLSAAPAAAAPEFAVVGPAVFQSSATWHPIAAPAVAPSAKGVIYFDTTDNEFKVSENGGSYFPLRNFWLRNGGSGYVYPATLTDRLGLGTVTPATLLDVAGNAQFGSGATKSTFTAAGVLQLASSLGAVYGGTGQSGVTSGDLLYGSGTNAWSRLGVGSSGQVLSVSGGFPTWQTIGALSGVVHLGPSSADADSTTNPSIWINKTGASGNLITLSTGSPATTQFVVTQSGNVGIGTASPDEKLTVAGNINQTGVFLSNGSGNNYFAGNVGIGTASPGSQLTVSHPSSVGEIRLDSASGGYTSIKTSHELRLHDLGGGAQTLRLGGLEVSSGFGDTIPSFGAIIDGAVGIGTNVPSHKLHVVGGILATSSVTAASFHGDGSALTGVTATDNTKVLKAGDTMTGQLTLLASTLTVTGNAFSVGGTTMVVREGYVGIGTSSPAEKLHVTGNVKLLKNSYIQFGDTWAEAGNNLIFRNGASTAFGISTIDGGSGFANGYSGFYSSLAIQGADGIVQSPSFGFTSEQGLGMYRPTATSLGFVTNNVERLRINSAGNVGIGTTNPQTLLDVAGNAQFGSGATKSTFTATGVLQLASSLGAVYGGTGQSAVTSGDLLYGSGTNAWSRLGVGSSGQVLSVSGGFPTWQTVGGLSGVVHLGPSSADADSTTNPSIWINKTGASGNLITLSTGSPATTQFVVTQSGQTGIGTASPDQKLTVAGNISQTGVVISSGTGNNYFAGNVGIGTASPGSQLTVSNPSGVGEIRVDSASGGYTSLKTSHELRLHDLSAGAQTLRLGGLEVSSGFGDTIPSYGAIIDGTVGIGTSSPGQKLDVQGGNVRLNNAFIGEFGFGSDWAGFSHISQTASTEYGLIVHNLGSYTFLNKKAVGSGHIGLRIDNVDKMVLLENGNVGIGTDAPSHKLHVAGGILATSSVTAASFHGDGSALTGITATDNTRVLKAGDTMTGQLTLLSSSLTVTGAGISNTYGIQSATGVFTGTGASVFGVDSSSGIRMNAGTLFVNGGAGIGTALPRATLDVAGNAQFGSGATKSTFTAAGVLQLASSLGAVYGGTGQSGVTSGDLLYGSGTNAWSRLGVGSSGQVLSVSGGFPTWQTIGTLSGVVHLGPSSADADSTTNPSIWINKTGASGNLITLSTGSPATTQFVVTQTGQTGIGTSSPQTQLEVNGSAQFGSGATKSTFTAAGVLQLASALGASYGGTGIAGAGGTSNRVLRTANGSTWTAGQVDLANDVSGALSDSALSSNVALLDRANQTFTGANTFTSSGTFTATGASTYSVGTSSGIRMGAGTLYVNGNLGLGTALPAKPFHLAGTGVDNGGEGDLLITGGALVGSGLSMRSTDSGGREWSIFSTGSGAGTGGAGNLAFFDVTGGAYRMVLRSSGNLGIATETPTHKLHVAGGILATSSVTASSFHGDGSALTGITATDNTKVLKAGDTMTGQLTLSGSTLTVTGNAFSVGTTTLSVLAGKVGVGTASPGWNLDVNGNARVGANTSQQTLAALSVSAGEGSAVRYRDIDLHGTWGVGEEHAITWTYGTTTGQQVAQITGRHNAPGSSLMFGHLYHGGDSTFDAMELRSTGTGAADLLLHNGALGVGTAVPGSRLEVKGAGATAATSGLNVTDSGGTSALFVRDDGRVGVGTTSPSHKLHVAGGIVATSSVTASSFHGDGSALTGVTSTDNTRVLKAGDTMTGQLTLSGSTLTVTGNAFSVGTSSFSVYQGSVTFGGLLRRTGSAAHGANAAGHVNLGTNSETGTAGQNYSYATVAGGLQSIASGDFSFVGGGINGLASGQFSSALGGTGAESTGTYSVAGGGVGPKAWGTYSIVLGGNSNIANLDHAIIVGGYQNVASGTHSNILGGLTNTASGNSAVVVGGTSNVGSGTTSFIGGGASNTASANYAVVAGGYSNTASGAQSTIGGGQSQEATGTFSAIAGGFDNIASQEGSFVGGGEFHYSTGTNSTVAGGYANYAGNSRSTVSGGQNNNASGPYATIGGGLSNQARTQAATVAGGTSNIASGPNGPTVGGGQGNVASGTSFPVVAGGGFNTASGDYAAIGGGYSNLADADSFVTIGGGNNNTASAMSATVGGGQNNEAFSGGDFAVIGGGMSNITAGDFSTVPGGTDNAASGDYSLAAGRQAKATAQGSFAWADSQGSDLQVTVTDQFRVRSGGGFYVDASSVTFSSGAITMLYIKSNGSVGIGTASPGQKLTVAGTIESTSGGVKFPDGTTQTTAAGGGSAYWSVSGSDIYNSNSGKVGIGSSTPGNKLFVADTTANTYQVGMHLAGGIGEYGGLAFSNSDGSTVWGAIQFKHDNSSDSSLRFRTWTGSAGGTEAMVIEGVGGNVGIANSNPTVRLHLGTGTPGASGGIQFGDTATDNIYRDPSYGGVMTDGNFRVASSALRLSPSDSTLYFYSDISLARNPSGLLTITSPNNIAIPSGNVGINDTTPDGLLDIVSDVAPTGFALSVSSQNDTTGNLFAVLGSGQVGIGTPTPESTLVVKSTASGVGAGVEIAAQGARGVKLFSSAADNFRLVTHTNTPNPNWAIGIGNGTDPYGLDTSKGYLYSDSAGNIGVGTSSPGASLDVKGSVDGVNMFLRNATGHTANYTAYYDITGNQWNVGNYATSKFAIFQNGTAPGNSGIIFSGDSVGIGTTSPNTKLHIVGGGIRLEQSDNADVVWRGSGQSADNKLWSFQQNGLQFHGRVIDDAESGAARWVSVTRSGAAITSTVFPNGNVGIGTTSPGATLDVAGTSQFGSGATKSTFTSTGNLQLVSGSTISANGTLTLSTAPTGALTTTPNVFLSTNGAVGIATNNPHPSSKLHVAGQARFTAGNLLLTNGSFGVYNMNPVARIHMSSGTLLVDGTGGKLQTKAGTSAPAASSCGSSPSVTGSDIAGKVTIGSGVTTSCTLGFSSAYAVAPACTVTGSATGPNLAATTSTSQLIITSSADMASNTVMYVCIGL